MTPPPAPDLDPADPPPGSLEPALAAGSLAAGAAALLGGLPLAERATEQAGSGPARASQDVLSGPLHRPLLRLAVPMFAGYVFQMGFNYVDTYLVSGLGADALAAVGGSMFMVWALFSLVEVVSVGVLARVARAVGAGQPGEVGSALAGGVAIGLVLDNVAAGVGDTVPAMLVEGLGTLLRLPLALGLAALGLGYAAVWSAIAATMLLKAAAFEVWFRAGRWAERELE